MPIQLGDSPYYQKAVGRRDMVVPHRTVTAVDGTTIPAANDSRWAKNPGAHLARVFADVSFTGGTNPSATLRYYLRSPSGDTSGVVGKGSTVTVNGNDKVFFDVAVEGDDLLVLVEAVGGAPTSFQVVLTIAWK